MNPEYRLDEIEQRVLGVLMEKSFTASDSYPMTLNAVTVACNQKSNRDPVLDLQDDDVWAALRRLTDRGLVVRILPAPGSRADKFKHIVADRWSWQSPQRAVMTELMLRGPQTPGELRTRCERMTPLPDLASVMQTLESLMNWNPPVVAPLPRGAGQSATRYASLICPEAHSPAAGSPVPSQPKPDAVAAEPGESSSPLPDDLREDVQNLWSEVSELREAVTELRRSLDDLQRKLGG